MVVTSSLETDEPQKQQQQQHFHGMQKIFYNSNSCTQGNAVQLCSNLLATAAQEVPLSSSGSSSDRRPLSVAEFGCSHGANSVGPIMLIAGVLQQRLAHHGSSPAAGHNSAPDEPSGQLLQLHITHEDVAANDWTALFGCTQQYQELIQQQCPCLSVTSAACGTSMYSRCFPDASVDLGFSYSALHWQSGKAVRLKHSINPGCSKTLPEEAQLLRAHAVADLKNFLTLRAQEFRPGGLLVLGYVGYNSQHPMQSMLYHDAAQAVADVMVAEGLLCPEDLGAMAAPVYFLDEATQRDIYSSCDQDWQLEHFDIVNAVSPKWALFQQGKIGTEEQAEVFVHFWRAIMEPSMTAGLVTSGGQRSSQQVAQLLNTFFSRMKAAAVAHPQPASYPLARVLLRRKPLVNEE